MGHRVGLGECSQDGVHGSRLFGQAKVIVAEEADEIALGSEAPALRDIPDPRAVSSRSNNIEPRSIDGSYERRGTIAYNDDSHQFHSAYERFRQHAQAR